MDKSLDGYDKNEQKDKEAYADYISEWEKRYSIEKWNDWTYSLLMDSTSHLAKQ